MPSTHDDSTPAARLAVRGLSKRFGRRQVLSDVCLDVEAGSIVLLAGSNGSGKTTLLRCIAGLASHEGTVRVDGRPCAADPASRQDIGYLPQAVGLPEWATVDEILDLFCRLRGASRSEDVPEGFLPPLHRRLGELSGGQRQRAALAVALLGRPRLLLLDEPAANLDDHGRRDLFDVLERLRREGSSVLVAAPSPADLNGLPDRTLGLVDGTLEASMQASVLVAASTPVEPCGPARVAQVLQEVNR